MVAQRSELRIPPPYRPSAMAAPDLEAVVNGRMRRTATDVSPPMSSVVIATIILIARTVLIGG